MPSMALSIAAGDSVQWGRPARPLWGTWSLPAAGVLPPFFLRPVFLLLPPVCTPGPTGLGSEGRGLPSSLCRAQASLLGKPVLLGLESGPCWPMGCSRLVLSLCSDPLSSHRVQGRPGPLL